MKVWVSPRKAKLGQGVRYRWGMSFFILKNEIFKD